MDYHTNKGGTTAPEVLPNSWCVTQFNVVKCTFMWMISNFSFCNKENSEVIRSSPFCATGDQNMWCLQINPEGLRSEFLQFLSVYLVLLSSEKQHVKAKFRLSLLNADKEEAIPMESNVQRFLPGMDWGFQHFLAKDYLYDECNQLLPNDTLTVYCEVSMLIDHPICEIKSDDMPKHGMDYNLGSLLESQLYADVTLSVGSKQFKAHKAVLAVRSPVFNAMFSHKMKEYEQNRVNITDLEEEVVHEMLTFMYTGETSSLPRMAEGLLMAADKYAMDKLKNICEEALSNELTVEKAALMLALADRYGADKLKQLTIEFINEGRARMVMETLTWKQVAEDQPTLILDVYRNLSKRCNVPLRPYVLQKTEISRRNCAPDTTINFFPLVSADGYF